VSLQRRVEAAAELSVEELVGERRQEALRAFEDLKAELNAGRVRAASRGADGVWQTHAWVKRGILLGFRVGAVTDRSAGGFPFFDKDTYPVKPLSLSDGVRLVPGGSSVRDGCFLGPGVTVMPPAYVNVGAYVGSGTMIDSHALVGSCAQVGSRCHVSAAAQLGGVLEPVGARPVIVEDEVLVGGNCGIYEGTLVRARAVLAAGVILTASTPLFDLVREQVYRGGEGGPLEVPAGAVVVPGTRPIAGGAGKAWGLSIYAPIIVKYRDHRTDGAVRLEDLLR
jgi:2,3,4,5-tetrahydropyridine-2-carboxylate N-succinyltransferase